MTQDEAEQLARNHLKDSIPLEPCDMPATPFTLAPLNKDDYICFIENRNQIGATHYVAVHKETGKVESFTLGE